MRRLYTKKNRATSQARREVPRTPNPYPTEEKEQIDLAAYLNRRFGYYGWIHVPNQRWAKPQYLKKLAAMGVKKGFPDILIFESFSNEKNLLDFYYGMAIELKRQKESRPKIEPDQKRWQYMLTRYGGLYTYIAYGAQDAINKIEEIYGPYRP